MVFMYKKNLEFKPVKTWEYLGGRNGESLLLLWGKSAIGPFLFVILFSLMMFDTPSVYELPPIIFSFVILVVSLRYTALGSVKRSYYLYEDRVRCEEADYRRLSLRYLLWFSFVLLLIVSVFTVYYDDIRSLIICLFFCCMLYREILLCNYWKSDFGLVFGERQELYVLKAKRIVYLVVGNDIGYESFLDRCRYDISFHIKMNKIKLCFKTNDDLNDFISELSGVAPDSSVFYDISSTSLILD